MYEVLHAGCAIKIHFTFFLVHSRLETEKVLTDLDEAFLLLLDLFRGNLLKVMIIYTKQRLHADGKKTSSHCSSPFADLFPASYSRKKYASMISFFDSSSSSHFAVRKRQKEKKNTQTLKKFNSPEQLSSVDSSLFISFGLV